MSAKVEETKLNPTEAQQLKEELEKGKVVSPEDYHLPRLTVTDADRDLYTHCLATRQPFQERFTRERFNMTVVFRDKTKREGDIISRQLDTAANKGLILSNAEYTNSYNLGCLYYQMEELNGVVQSRVYPEKIYDQKDFDLLAVIDSNSPIGGMTSSMLYLLMGIMTQFNQKLMELSREALNPNFS